MTKVYVCFRGEYSDAHIVAVFSTKEAADKLNEYGPVYIEEWDVDSVNLNFPVGRLPYTAYIHDKNGEVTSTDAYLTEPESFVDGGCQYHDYNGNPPRGIMGLFTTRCWAIDPHHAAKIASERRSVYLANNRPG